MFNELRVIYLEDEPLVALDTNEHLNTLGFKDVTVAYRLSQAEAAVAQNRFDIAILDINVDRGQTSIDLGKELAASGARVIFASGNGDDAEALRKQGFWFLDKPFSLNALTQKIKATID